MALPEGPNAVEPQTSQPISHRRPLQREGAHYFLSAAEQAMEDAMLRSSLLPEILLESERGKEMTIILTLNPTRILLRHHNNHCRLPLAMWLMQFGAMR
jgi:hypothetical protein